MAALGLGLLLLRDRLHKRNSRAHRVVTHPFPHLTHTQQHANTNSRNARQPFCWLCGQATGVQHTWTSIANHSCGRFKEEADARMDAAAASHKRYMHYFSHFKSHADSAARELDNRAKLLARIAEGERGGVAGRRDYGWLVAALDRLRVARRVLCNSYAFAFWFFGAEMFAEDFKDDEGARRSLRALFEDQQETLAGEVERLSGLADRAAEALAPDDDAAAADGRYAVLNSTANVGARIANFMSLVENELYARVASLAAQIAPPAGTAPGAAVAGPSSGGGGGGFGGGSGVSASLLPSAAR